ncbi:MAG: ABC transporter substrate-binding protein, partial [Solirubrobacteraceae bacterium]
VSGSTQFAFLGYVPLMSARSQGLPVKVVANADNGAETADKEWTLILTKKGSPIMKPADLPGKTIAVNALKGVGEVAIKAALRTRMSSSASRARSTRRRSTPRRIPTRHGRRSRRSRRSRPRSPRRSASRCGRRRSTVPSCRRCSPSGRAAELCADWRTAL